MTYAAMSKMSNFFQLSRIARMVFSKNEYLFPCVFGKSAAILFLVFKRMEENGKPFE